MAKVTEHEDAIPERLARFIADEWGDEDPAGQWGKAARQWLADHPGRSLPLARDSVEVRQWTVALRRSLAEAGHPHPGPRMPADPWSGEREDPAGPWRD